MRRNRDIIQHTHERLLDVISAAEAEEVMIDHHNILKLLPNHFLQQLGVFDSGEITLTKLYVASANVIARDTVLWHVQDL